MDLSVVIPTYNEKENLEELTQRLSQALEETSHEIIIVDDDSPDGTFEEAERIKKETNRNVRPILRTKNPGLSKSVVKGFEESEGEIVVVMDADLQHPPEKVPALVEKISDKSPVTVGTRYNNEGGVKGWSRFRKTVSKGAVTLSKIIVPEARKSSDPVSGFFAVKKDRVNTNNLSPHGYKILLEILSQVRPEKVDEVGFNFEEREKGESNLGLQHYIKFLEHAAECRLKHHEVDKLIDARKAVRFTEFGAVGATGVLINNLIFLPLTSINVHYAIAGLLAFAAAVQWNFLWNWLITFNKPSENLKEKYVKFNTVSLGGLALYQAALFLMIGVLEQPELLSNLVAILTSFLWNFTGSEEIAFQPE